MHFHWDDQDNSLGSEHAVDGKKYPLEAHFVHYNCERESYADAAAQYPNISTIIEAKQQGIDVHELGVIGVFFRVTRRDNPAIDSILDAIEVITRKEQRLCKPEYQDPELNCVIDESKLNETQLEEQEKIKEELEKILVTEADGIDWSKILTDKLLNGGFYSYEGSLTTPPCTDDVRWFNMETPSYISEAQLWRYREATRPCKPDELMAPNWRPLQQNINTVFECTGNPDSDSGGGDGDGSDSDSSSSDSSDSDSSDDSDDALATIERGQIQQRIMNHDHDDNTFWNRYKELIICIVVGFMVAFIAVCCQIHCVWKKKYRELNSNSEKEKSPIPIKGDDGEMQKIMNVDSDDSCSE